MRKLDRRQEWEVFNTLSHALGSIIAIVALIYIISIRKTYMNIPQFLSIVVYLISLFMMFTCSAVLHHSAIKGVSPTTSKVFTLFDYSSIYCLIAGTYTPFIVYIYQGEPTKQILWLVLVWSLALIGIVYQLFFNGKYKHFSTILYILLGWIILFMVKPTIAFLPPHALYLLVAGGLFYTFGTIFFSIKKDYMHGIWHLFVLAGAVSMLWAMLIVIKM